jgi:S1-C subfamily serine protease
MIKNIFGALLLFSFTAVRIVNAQQENLLLQRVIPVACHERNLSFIDAYTKGTFQKDCFKHGYGVIIKTGIAVTVYHVKSFPKGEIISANGGEANIIAACATDDLLLLKIKSEKFDDIPLELNPAIGKSIMTFSSTGKWSRQMTGKIAKIDNNKGTINLSELPIQYGDSGKPVYTASGKLVGVICRFPSQKDMEMGHSAVLVSVKRIAELMEMGNRISSK